MRSLSTFEAFKHIETSEGMVEVVGQKLLDLQDTLFEMLVEVTDFFDKNGIIYTLGGGSCLGAVRHEGFIPWDDDIDLNVPRSSYEVLRKRFPEGLGDRYWLRTPEETSNYGLCFAQIRKKGTIVRTREDLQTNECGVCIDIFIVENVPDVRLLRLIHGFGSLALGFALSCRRFANQEDLFLSIANRDNDIRRVFKTKSTIGKLFSFASVDSWTRWWNMWNSLCGDEGSFYVVVPAGRRHYFGELYERATHYPVTLGLFEGRPVNLPARPDVYLKQLYGQSYMEIPQESNYESHVVYEFDLGDDPR